MDGTKTTTNWIIAGLVALVVIIGGGWLVARERSGTATGSAATSTEIALGDEESDLDITANTTGTGSTVSVPQSKNPVASASGEAITVADQPAGNTVSVADARLTKPSWVVIRDTKGWALGAAWLNESQTNVTVSVLRNTMPGQTYEAVIYVDNGDKKFELHGGDMLVASSQGAPVSSTFTAK